MLFKVYENQVMYNVSLRDIFWLLIVVAVGLGWWVSNRRWSRESEALRSKARMNSCGYVLEEIENYLQSEGYSVEWEDGSIHISSSKGSNVTLHASPATDTPQ